MNEEQWKLMCDFVANRMTVATRAYVNILAGGAPGSYTEIGTGTFIEKNEDINIITCEHVSRLDPAVYFLDSDGSEQLRAGAWKASAEKSKDIALALVSPEEWNKISTRAQPLSATRLAGRHAPVQRELLFFRGIAGENANYIGNFGVDAIISGYCSQEKMETGDDQIFEILWSPDQASIASGASEAVRKRFKYTDPAGFSGSLVWNTRFVECGCDLLRWSPSEAIVTGLLRRFDPDTDTLLVWRIEHVQKWLATGEASINQEL